MAYKRPHTLLLGFQASSSNPNDSTTYYVGGQALSWSTVANAIRLYIPKKARIVAVQCIFYNGTSGSSENTEVYLRLNNSTDTTLDLTADFGTSFTVVYKDNLNIEVDVTDYVAIKIITPAWASNPSGIYVFGNIILECD